MAARLKAPRGAGLKAAKLKAQGLQAAGQGSKG